MPACSFTRSRACVRACVHSLDLAILIHPSLPPSLIVGSTLRCILVLQEQRGPRDALGHAAAGREARRRRRRVKINRCLVSSCRSHRYDRLLSPLLASASPSRAAPRRGSDPSRLTSLAGRAHAVGSRFARIDPQSSSEPARSR